MEKVLSAYIKSKFSRERYIEEERQYLNVTGCGFTSQFILDLFCSEKKGVEISDPFPPNKIFFLWICHL